MKKEMHIWRKFINETLQDFTGDFYLTESTMPKNTYIYLFEGKKRVPKKVCFEALINNRNQKQVFKLWEQSLEYEYQQLLNEGVLDVIASAYEKTKEGVIKIKDNVSSAAQSAMKKVNDFFIEKAVQAISLAKRGGAVAIKALSPVMKKIGSCKQ